MKRLAPILFWIFAFLAWQQVVYFYIVNRADRFLFTAFDIALLLLTFYSLYSFVTPRLFFRRNKFYFSLAFLAATGLAILFISWIAREFLNRDIVPISFEILWSSADLLHNFYFIALLGAAAGLVTRLSMHWVQSERKMKSIEKDRVSTELQYLRMQLNPHFLFNALNTVYIQIDNSTAAAKETLNLFSGMLRYQLFECNTEKVPIDKEIAFLKNYIEIATIRKDASCSIDFLIPDLTGFDIAPFLLIPLIENMFKHVSADRPFNRIEGRLSAGPREIVFTGRNTVGAVKKPDPQPGGIGLANLRDVGRHLLPVSRLYKPDLDSWIRGKQLP